MGNTCGFKDLWSADVTTDTAEDAEYYHFMSDVTNESITITLTQYFSLTITIYQREFRLQLGRVGVKVSRNSNPHGEISPPYLCHGFAMVEVQWRNYTMGFFFIAMVSCAEVDKQSHLWEISFQYGECLGDNVLK